MTKILLFPGQGSQFKGMGRDLLDAYPDQLALANDILGYNIGTLCLEDPERLLGKTEYTQPALYVVNALSWRRHAEDHDVPDFMAGHSLGEYNALLAAGAFDFATGLKLVQKRGQLMGQVSGGGMLAVLNMRLDALRDALYEHHIDALDVANYNTPAQIILSGLRADIVRAEIVLTAKGVRCMPLNVSAAFHSRYMKEAMAEFAQFLTGVPFAPLQVPVIANFTARPYGDADIPALLARQIAGSVLWSDSMLYLMGKTAPDGAAPTFIELGGTTVLSRMLGEIQAGRSVVPTDGPG